MRKRFFVFVTLVGLCVVLGAEQFRSSQQHKLVGQCTDAGSTVFFDEQLGTFTILLFKPIEGIPVSFIAQESFLFEPLCGNGGTHILTFEIDARFVGTSGFVPTTALKAVSILDTTIYADGFESGSTKTWVAN